MFSADINSKETNIYRNIEETKFADNDFFIFKGNHILVELYNPSEKIVIVKEEIDGIDIDDIGNLEALRKNNVHP